MSTILLASGSPRRRELLAAAGLSCTVTVPAVDEQVFPGERPAMAAERLACLKRDRVLDRETVNPGVLVVAADTLIDLDGLVLGKPETTAAAVEMLTALSGREHLVHTGIALFCDGRSVAGVSSSRVLFRKLDRDEILEYVNAEPVLDCAGSYRIQNRGAFFVESITGSYSGIVGLPMELFYRESLKIGFHLLGGRHPQYQNKSK